ncbi:MAG: type II toxin-antitoxin system HicA family toxin [Zoogloeaceae bacterium]|jgi:hypothetical protein|nr:type II toxin-antitoxin system HicA family toxin [Zoogloeaceae bacterium]
MNAKHRKTLAAIFSDPVCGTIEWSRIESLLLALGCVKAERGGSAVMFMRDGLALQVHRPHPKKEALRYRVLATREFLKEIGVTP